MASAAAVAAQQASPQPPPEVFGESIDVRVVNVEAEVTDAKGERVHGLSAGDLRLLVDGRETPIEYFTEVEQGKASTAGPQAPVAAGEGVGRNYLLYIDESFAVARLRDSFLDKLERDLPRLAPGDRMAVLASDGTRLDVLCGWTGDAATLAAALERAHRRPTGGNQQIAHQRSLKADVDLLLENSIGDGDPSPYGNIMATEMAALSGRSSPEARSRLGKTAPSVATALRGFEAPPGRKVLLFVSAAWSLRVEAGLYRPMIEAANQLGYTVYPVDTAQADPYEIIALDHLAAATGGRAVLSSALEPFREVVDDSGSYYWLGFTPVWKADDRRHRVTVETRRPGLTVRARAGFADTSKQTRNALKAESVLLFGSAGSDRRLAVRFGEARRVGRGEVEVPLTLDIPFESLTLVPTGGGYAAEVFLAMICKDENGERAEQPRARMRTTVPAVPTAGATARFHVTVRLRNIRQRLAITVQDPASGNSLWGEADYPPRGAADGRE
jgi:VWFA-related protein